MTTLAMPSWWPSRGFLAGLAITAPFIANPVPIWVAALFVVPLIVDLFYRGFKFRPYFRPTPTVLVLYALAALHLAALVLGTTSFWQSVLGPLIWSGSVVGIILTASDEEYSPSDMIPGFFFGIVAAGIPIALAGLIKYALQQQGYIIGSMINKCFGRYPQGTTFCGDYNIFGLFMVVAALGVSVLLLSRRWSKWQSLGLLVSLAIILTAGFFAGSRRFSFIVILVPALWLAYAVRFSQYAKVAKLAVVPIVGTFLLFQVFNYPYPKVADDDLVIVEESLSATVARLFSEDPVAEPSGVDKSFLAARDVSPRALAGTMAAEHQFGFDSRLQRWQYGWDLVSENGYVLGSGFNYLEKFSCRYVMCEFADYPHAPLISSWIGFGVVGFCLALGFYLILAINILRSEWSGVLSGASFVALAVLPYSLISGDTLFSLPHAIGGALLVAASIPRTFERKAAVFMSAQAAE